VEGEEYVPPGALVLRSEGIKVNEGRERVKVKVTNTGDRPIQVRSLLLFLPFLPLLSPASFRLSPLPYPPSLLPRSQLSTAFLLNADVFY
jgi:hypothetical protein